MRSYKTRLNRLANLPQNKIPAFRVEHVDGTTRTLYGYQLVIPHDVRRVQYDPTQPCALADLDPFSLADALADGDGRQILTPAQAERMLDGYHAARR